MAEGAVVQRGSRFREFLRTLKGRLIVTTCFFLVPTAVTLTMVIVQSTCNPKSWECSYMGPAFMFLGLGFSSAVFIVTIRYCRQLQRERHQQRMAGAAAQNDRWQEAGYYNADGDGSYSQQTSIAVHDDSNLDGLGNNSGDAADSHGRPAMIVYWIEGVPLRDSYAGASIVDAPPPYGQVACPTHTGTASISPSPAPLLTAGLLHAHHITDQHDADRVGMLSPMVKRPGPGADDDVNSYNDKDLPNYEDFLRSNAR